MSLSDDVTGLTTATQALHQEVIDRLGSIDVAIIDTKIAEITGFWTDKEIEIDDYWVDKEVEINQRLSDYGNQVLYVAPATMGTGDGLSSINATTLHDVLSNKLVKTATNTIYLKPGEHVVNSLIVDNCYWVEFIPEGVYNPLSPIVICTENTQEGSLCRDTNGDPSESQLCDAHGYDEYPIFFKNSRVKFTNIDLRGTHYGLYCEKTQIISEGHLNIECWVHSIACTKHVGIGIFLKDSVALCNNTGDGLTMGMWHPDYISCQADLEDYGSPIVLDNSIFIELGIFTWINNIGVAEYPVHECVPLGNITTSYETAIVLLNHSKLQLNQLSFFNVRQLFYLSEDSTIIINHLTQEVTSEPLQWLGQAASNVIITAKTGIWPAPITISNNSNVPSLLGKKNARFVLDGSKFEGHDASNDFISLEEGSTLICCYSTISAADRGNNSGFAKILTNENSTAVLFDNAITTRNTGSDSFANQSRLGRTSSKNNTITTSLEFTGDGCYIDNAGNKHDCGGGGGAELLTENTVLTVPSGSYPTVQDAIAFVANNNWNPDEVEITINIAAGTYPTIGGKYYELIKNKENLIINGADTPIETTIVTLVGVTGAEYEYFVTFQLTSTVGMSVGQAAIIVGAWSDAVNDGRFYDGCFEITEINGNNITVLNKASTSSGGSGMGRSCNSGNVTVYLTTLGFGLWVEEGKVEINNLTFCSNLASYSSQNVAIHAFNNSQINTNNVSTTGWARGFQSSLGSLLITNGLCAASNALQIGFYADNAQLDAKEGPIATGNWSGFRTQGGGFLYARLNAVASGNDYGVVSRYANAEVIGINSIYNSISDHFAEYGGYINATDSLDHASIYFTPAAEQFGLDAGFIYIGS